MGSNAVQGPTAALSRNELEQRIGELRHGDHLCMVYENRAEQMAAATLYLKHGLAAGDLCVYAVDDQTVEEVASALAAGGIDVEREQARGALRLMTKHDAYLRTGSFDPHEMIEFFRRITEQALADGFAGFRITGEMTWALGSEPGCDQVIACEALVNGFFPNSRALALCQYNRQRFSPAMIHDVLRSHPLAVLGDQVCQNFYYEPPELVLDGSDKPQRLHDRVQWMISQLRRGEREVAERRRVEKALRESEEFSRRVIESSQDCIKVLDLDGRLLSISAGGMRLLELQEPAPLINRSWIQCWKDADAHAAKEAVAAAAAGGVGKFEGFRPTRTGKPKWWDVIITPILDGNQRPHRLLSISRDITERKQAEQKLRQQNERLRLLWEAAGVLLSNNDPDVMLHKLFEQIREHLQLDAYFNFIISPHGDGLEMVSYAGIPDETVREITQLGFIQSVCETVTRQRRAVVATQIQESDDPKLQLAKSLGLRAYACNPLMVGDRLLGSLSFASRRRDSFDPDELEFLQVISHYVTIAYERMQFIRTLRENDQRKDEFLAMLAHELRNPLAPIRSGLDLLGMTGADGEIIEPMQQQVEHLVRLVDDLLDVSRIMRGKVELRKEPVELTAVVDRALQTVRPLVDSHGHHLFLSLPSMPVWLEADSVRLSQALGNLLNNAVKYTESGGNIWLEATAPNGQVEIRVRDTGIGMDPRLLNSVFDLFTQGDRSLDRSQGGLGIGLTVVKNLIEMHGGSVTAASDGPGKGSEFVVKLPVQKPNRAVREDEPEIRPTASHRVLIVEDNVAAAKMLSLLLSKLGQHELRLAHDGTAALQLVQTFRPDFVLLDLGLPRMDGFEVVRRLRATPGGDQMLIAALTGYGTAEDQRKSQEAGFDEHLVKPTSLETLQKLLQHPKLTGGRAGA